MHPRGPLEQRSERFQGRIRLECLVRHANFINETPVSLFWDSPAQPAVADSSVPAVLRLELFHSASDLFGLNIVSERVSLLSIWVCCPLQMSHGSTANILLTGLTFAWRSFVISEFTGSLVAASEALFKIPKMPEEKNVYFIRAESN